MTMLRKVYTITLEVEFSADSFDNELSEHINRSNAQYYWREAQKSINKLLTTRVIGGTVAWEQIPIAPQHFKEPYNGV